MFVTNNSVMRYVFTPQSNCKFPENLDELNVTSTKGEVLSKQIDHLGQLVVIVLLRLDNVVQSVDIDFGQVYNDNFAANYQVNEKRICGDVEQLGQRVRRQVYDKRGFYR